MRRKHLEPAEEEEEAMIASQPDCSSFNGLFLSYGLWTTPSATIHKVTHTELRQNDEEEKEEAAEKKDADEEDEKEEEELEKEEKGGSVVYDADANAIAAGGDDDEGDDFNENYDHILALLLCYIPYFMHYNIYTFIYMHMRVCVCVCIDTYVFCVGLHINMSM